MGCCVSAANNIQEPQNKNNKPTKQTDSEIKHEYSQEKQEIQPNNEDQNEYQNQEKKFVQRKHDPPCKYPKPQKKDDDEMDQFYTSNPKVLKPPRNEKLHKLIKFGREYIEQMHHNSETDKQIINEIEQLIFNKQITIQELNEIAIKYNKTLIQTLFLKGCQGITLLELILIYIEDFEIITHLLQEHQLPINDDLYYIVLRIISKIKPLRKIDSQVQLSINFIKQIYNFQQIKSLLLHKDAIIFFNGFSNFCSEFNLKNRIHIKLLGTIVKLLKNFQIDSTLDLLYKNAKIDSYFTYLQVPKSIPKGQVDQINCSKIELTYLKMNLFHWIALKNEWLLFKQYSNNYYQQLDVSEQSPFMIFMEKSPINFILEYLNEYPSQLKQASNYSTSQGKNILHCFFMNKNISEQHEEEILKILANFQSLESLKQLLLQAYHDQIPLICYLDSHQNVLNSVCEFLSQYITKEFNFIKQFIQATEISHMIKKTKYKDLKKNHNLYIHEKYYFFLKINNKLRKQELQTKKLTENDIIYLHYIQLVKQVIKKDFKVNFDWIKTFNIYTSYFPYDIGTTQQTFMNVLLRKGHQEQVKQTITQIVELIKSNENVDAYINTQIEFSLKAQLLAQLISFKKEQRQYPYQIVYDLVDTIVMEQINENPKLLIVSIYGNSDFKLIGYQTIYSTLVQLNDQKLQESCLTAQLLFDIDQKTKQQFLNTAFELQLLNSKDHLLKKIFDSFSIRAKLNMVRQNKTHIFQITLYDHLNQKEDQEIFSIHFSTFLQLETKGKLSKRSIIQQFLEKDDNNKQNQYVSVNLTYPNLLVLNQHIDTQKKFIEIAEIYPFPFLSKFWLMKEKINFNPQIQIGKNNKKTATFCNLILDHYELAFDWQMTGILVNIINSVVPQKNILYTLSHKKQVIYYQINQKISFLEALAQSDKLSQEFQSYMSTFQNGKQNFKLNLSKMIKLGAIYNNIIYLSNFYSQNLIGFIVKLADENFSFEINGKRKTYTQDNKKVSKFNKLLSILLELDIPKHEKEDKITYNFSNIISLITLENWKKINYNTKTSIYETFNKESVIELLYQDKNQEILKLIIEDIFNRWSIEQIELIINHCIADFKSLIKIFIQCKVHKTIHYIKSITIAIQQMIFQISNSNINFFFQLCY